MMRLTTANGILFSPSSSTSLPLSHFALWLRSNYSNVLVWFTGCAKCAIVTWLLVFTIFLYVMKMQGNLDFICHYHINMHSTYVELALPNSIYCLSPCRVHSYILYGIGCHNGTIWPCATSPQTEEGISKADLSIKRTVIVIFLTKSWKCFSLETTWT